MKQQFQRAAAVTVKIALLLGLVGSEGLYPVYAGTQVQINVNVGTPPPVIVRERPTMVYLAEPAAFVAVGIPFDVFFVSGRYYYFHGNNWFWGRGYNGPWVAVPYRTLPPGLQKYKVERLHEFRDREYRVYKVQGHSFKGRHFEAEEFRDEHSNNGNGTGNSNSNGNGHGNGNGKGK